MNINAEVFDIIRRVPEGHFIFVENIESGESNWSKEAVEYLGFSDEVIGNTQKIIQDISHPEDKERIQQEFEEVFSKQKKAFYLSFRIKNAKGDYVPCTCKGNIVFDEGGEPYIFTGSITVHKIEEEYDAVTDLPNKSVPADMSASTDRVPKKTPA